MSSEAITRNDLTNILNGVLPPTPSEYRKLLWTNPNPTSSFAAQTISLDLSDYDEVEIEAKQLASGSIIQLCRVGIGKQTKCLFRDGNANNFYTRTFIVSASSVQFGDAYYNATLTNTDCVPTAIYGIKYERVAPPQVEEWEEIPISYTVTTGDDSASNFMLKAYKSGDLLQWRMQGLNRAATTSAGANMWGATITGLPSSFIDVMGSSFYNTSHIDVYFQCTGATTATISARVTGASLAANCVINGISAMTRFI